MLNTLKTKYKSKLSSGEKERTWTYSGGEEGPAEIPLPEDAEKKLNS